MFKKIVKHRKALFALTMAAMALKSQLVKKDVNKDTEDIAVKEAKQLLTDKGYQIVKADKLKSLDKATNTARYAQKLYQDNPELVKGIVKVLRKLGKL